MTVSISTKFRKVILEDRVGVLQGLLLRLTTSKDKDTWWKISRCDVTRLSTFGTDHEWNAWSRNVFCTRHYFLIMTEWCYISPERFLKDIWIADKSYFPICVIMFNGIILNAFLEQFPNVTTFLTKWQVDKMTSHQDKVAPFGLSLNVIERAVYIKKLQT